MSTTTFPVNDANAVKLWSKKLSIEAVKATDVAAYIGDDAGSIIHRKTETEKGKGDQVTFSLRVQLTGDGFTEGQPAEGNGESLTIYSDAIVINELGHVVGVMSENSIDDQRVPFNMRDEARAGLAEWFQKRLSVTFFNQICGYTPANSAPFGTKYTGMQAVTAPSAGRQLWAGSLTADESLGSTNIISLGLLDNLKEMATNASPLIRPINVKAVGGDVGDFENVQEGMYTVFLHPFQVTDLRKSTSSGQWQDIQKAAMTGGMVTKNPIFTGALGVYNNLVLKPAIDVTQGVNSSTGAAITTVRRAVLCGAQAAVTAYGQKHQNSKLRWNEELLDHKRKLEVSAWKIWGMKKARYNSTDYGTIVLSTYAAAHT
jgi:N4-gp56 family major capsid protein